MLLFLLVVVALFLLWIALAPRTGERALRTRQALALGLPFQKSKTSGEPFNDLLARAAGAPEMLTRAIGPDLAEMQSWFNGLTDQERKHFEKQVFDACEAAGADADWFRQAQAKGEMENALHETVLLHALAIWRARAMEPFALYKAYRAKPNARGNRALAQRVFAQLAETRTIAIPPNMLLGTDQERAAYVRQAIEQAAQENPDVVMAIFKQVSDEQKKPKNIKTAQTETQDTQTVPSGLVEVSA